MQFFHKHKALSLQFIRYFGVALIGYLCDFGTLVVLHSVLHVNVIVATTCGFVFGLIVLYVLSGKFVFGESKIKSKTHEFIIFALIGLIGLAILDVLMWIFVDTMHINYLVAKVVATVFVYAWNFLARRKLYHD